MQKKASEKQIITEFFSDRVKTIEKITYPYFPGFSLSQVIDMNTLIMEYQQAREIFCDLLAVRLNSQLKNHKFSCLEQHLPSKGQAFFRCLFAFSSCDSVPNTSSLQSSVDCWVYHEREIDYLDFTVHTLILVCCSNS